METISPIKTSYRSLAGSVRQLPANPAPYEPITEENFGERNNMATTNSGKQSVSVDDAVEAILGLKETNPIQFVKIAEQLSEAAKPIANTLVGENHPLRHIMGAGKNTALRQRIRENIREARMLEEQESNM